MRGNSGIIGPSHITSSSSAGGLHDTYDQYTAKTFNIWPQFQVESIVNNNGTSLNEETNNTVTVTTTGIPDGTTLYYSFATVSGTTVVGADFAGGLSGSFTITSNSGSFGVTPLGDSLSESDVVKIQIRRGSISGDILGESENLTVGDAATPTGQDITSSFYEISNRFIDSGDYMRTVLSYDGPYDVGEVQTDFGNSAATYGRIYLGIKITAATTYYNDVCVAGVQILDPTRTTLLQSYIFNSSGITNWYTTYQGAISGTSSTGFPVTPSQANSSYNYTTVGTTNTNRWSWTTDCPSPFTGCADGISNTYLTTIAPLGNATVPQSSGTYFAYREASGSFQYSSVIMRGPFFQFTGGEWIRVIHALPGYVGKPMNSNDSLYVAVL